MTDLVRRLGFVSFEVGDVDEAVDFYRRVCQLAVTERGRDQAFLSGGTDHHWLRLRQGEAGTFRLGFEVVGVEALDEVADRLDAAGIAYREGDGFAADWLDRSLVFEAPDGVELELFVQMAELAVAPPHTIARFQHLVHAVWFSDDPIEHEAFYRDVLGFRTSDWIERLIVFMRCGNGFHHSLAVGASPGGAARLDHVCFEMESLDDVMRLRNHAVASGVTLRNDLLRHAASGSVGVYLTDPGSGLGVEFCVGHRVIAHDENYRPRIMVASPVTADVWQQGPPDESPSPSRPLLIAAEGPAARLSDLPGAR
jgi:2,3-dihydroxy-p-cumate/2,3-dihydroxybenzoate 3,4-dioxygenase